MRILWSVLLVLLLVPDWSGAPHRPLLDPAAPVRIEPVDLVKGHPELRRLGGLHFLRGYRLRSADPNFGGFSSLSVAGDHFTLLSDGGGVLEFTLDARGRMSAVRLRELPAGPLPGWEKEDRDSESMAVDPRTGQIWVGFETHNEIWRYAAGFARAERHAAPGQMRNWAANKGAESLVRLADGGFIAIEEARRSTKRPGVVAIRFAGDPTEAPERAWGFRYVPPGDQDEISDGAELPDGRLIVLQRNVALFEGFTAALAIADLKALQPGAVVRGRPLARFAGRVLHDNFEGVAVQRRPDGTHIWLVSDDNQSVLQQTLLLEFRLLPGN